MKILKNAGEFEVLSKTEDIISSIANAARTCYQSQDKSTPENDIKLVKNLITRGHGAMIEFADITIKFKNVSRGLTHELVRHRVASFAQKSTRYVDEEEFELVFPPNLDKDRLIIDGLDLTIEDICNQNELVYRNLRVLGYKPEDARQFLYTAETAEIVMKVNLRELRHIFTMRCDYFAHWEIRTIMLDLLKWCKENIPVIFDDFKFLKLNNIDYARPILSSFNMSDKFKDYVNSDSSLEEFINKLPKDITDKLYQELKIRNT